MSTNVALQDLDFELILEDGVPLESWYHRLQLVLFIEVARRRMLGQKANWLRLFHPDGRLVPTKDERAEQHARRAEQAEREKEAAEVEIARLRARLAELEGR